MKELFSEFVTMQIKRWLFKTLKKISCKPHLTLSVVVANSNCSTSYADMIDIYILFGHLSAFLRALHLNSSKKLPYHCNTAGVKIQEEMKRLQCHLTINASFFYFFFIFIYLFIFGCVGSSSLCQGFL